MSLFAKINVIYLLQLKYDGNRCIFAGKDEMFCPDEYICYEICKRYGLVI